MLTHVAVDIRKSMAELEKKIEWVKCQGCYKNPGDEWSRLDYNGLCPICNAARASGQIIESAQTFGKFNVTEENEVAHRKAKEFTVFGSSAYVWGLPGRGKSHLANAARHELKRVGKSCAIYTFNELLMALKDGCYGEGRSEAEFFNELCAPEYLIIDDIRINPDNPEFVSMTLYTILNQREKRSQGKVLMTSNHPISDFSKIDSRVTSRIIGLCGEDNIVKIGGQDYRGKK